jgi:hypothetical protein
MSTSLDKGGGGVVSLYYSEERGERSEERTE